MKAPDGIAGWTGPPDHLCPILPAGLLRWLAINFGTCVSGGKSTTAIGQYREPVPRPVGGTSVSSKGHG